MVYHQILDINLSKLYFRFPYDLLPSESFLLMKELRYCTDLQEGQVHQLSHCVCLRVCRCVSVYRVVYLD